MWRETRPLLALSLLSAFAHSLALADTFPAANAAAATVAATATASAAAATVTSAATVAGNTFTVPQGWTLVRRGPLVVLSPSETDLRFALIDVEATDAMAAAAAGWRAFDPTFARPVRAMTPSGPQNGWEEQFVIEYEVSPNEKRVVTAYVQRAAKSWLVGLLQSSEATADKRGGPLSLLTGSLRPRGYRSESFAGRGAHAIDAARIAAMKDFVAAGMEKLKVPGVAFSLIDGGKIVYEGGIGVRELGKPEPLDENTLFIAASITKALSTLLLAELVDEKKLRWDEPVTEAYRPFKLGDAATTRKMLIRHLVCACTGMPRQDLEWLFQGPHETPETTMTKLGTMQPTSEFGEVFQYSNLMAAAAGFVGGTIAVPNTELGKAYDDAMQKKVLTPLGMKRSTFDFAQAMQGNYARPHDVDIDGHLTVGEMTFNYSAIPIRPAAGIWTSAHDLSQYVMMELANGRLPNGRRLVSEQNLLERRKPNVVVSADIQYGMGLMIDKRWGVTVIHHDGDMAGYHSDMLWLPDYNVGAVILANSDTSDVLYDPFMRKFVELLFDGNSEASARLDAAATDLDVSRAIARERLQSPPNAAAAGALAGRYRNEALGEVVVTHRGKDVWFHYGQMQSQMASRTNDDGSVSFMTITPTLQGLEFVVEQGGQGRTMTTRDAQHEYLFKEE